ncbi:MAG: hypothetical protein HQL79_11480, partial [Magnetococcales bacterium]|nr:hypothetical protein [Magnetococcales bacterium]
MKTTLENISNERQCPFHDETTYYDLMKRIRNAIENGLDRLPRGGDIASLRIGGKNTQDNILKYKDSGVKNSLDFHVQAGEITLRTYMSYLYSTNKKPIAGSIDGISNKIALRFFIDMRTSAWKCYKSSGLKLFFLPFLPIF